MTAQRVRFAALDPDQKTRLLDPAEREFVQHGFEKASMNRILSAAAMSKGQAYYYIESKSDLYAHVFERAFTPLAEKIAITPRELSSVKQFWTWVEKSFRSTTVFFEKYSDLAALGRTAYESAAAYEALSSSEQSMQIAFQNIVTQGQSIGAIRRDLPTDLITSMLFAILKEIDRWFALNSAEISPPTAAKLEKKLLNLLKSVANGN